MKKILFLFTILALGFTACTSDDDPDNGSESKSNVMFKAFVGKQSRATVDNMPALQANGFKVTAAYTGVDDMSASAALNFLTNEPVTYVDPDWTYANLKFWPANLNEKISFFGYATMGGNETITTTTGYPELEYTVADGDENQKDILVGSLVNQTRPVVNTPVIFEFNHALTAILFAMKTDHTANQVHVTDFEVDCSNLTNNGTFTFGDTFAASSWALGTTNHAITDDAIVENVDILLGTGSYADITGNDNILMLLPQTIGASDVTVKITFSLTTSAGAVVDNYTATGTLPAGTWDKGKSYMYNITLKVNDVLSQDYAITFGNPTINPWQGSSIPHDIP